MDFEYTSEQQMLRESIARYLGDRYRFAERQAMVRSAAGWRPQIWQELGEQLGILGAPFSEALGGLGGGAVESMIVMEEFGRVLAIEPWLDTIVIGGGLLRRWDHARARELIGLIIAGQLRCAFAYPEPHARFDLTDVATTAVASGAGWRIDGFKDGVAGAPFATHLLVTARHAGGRRDPRGVAVYLVPRDGAGVALREYPTVDGSRAADVRFEAASAELIGDADAGIDALEAAVDEGVAALCAEAVGVLRCLLADTLRYAKERRQFGAPIAANQVLQHRMVDMYIALEQAVSMTCMATMMLARPAAERRRAVSAAKVQVGKAARLVGQGAVQIHGAMGMTDDLAVSHYFRRATLIESQLGSVDHHCARLEQDIPA